MKMFSGKFITLIVLSRRIVAGAYFKTLQLRKWLINSGDIKSGDIEVIKTKEIVKSSEAINKGLKNIWDDSTGNAVLIEYRAAYLSILLLKVWKKFSVGNGMELFDLWSSNSTPLKDWYFWKEGKYLGHQNQYGTQDEGNAKEYLKEVEGVGDKIADRMKVLANIEKKYEENSDLQPVVWDFIKKEVDLLKRKGDKQPKTKSNNLEALLTKWTPIGAEYYHKLREHDANFMGREWRDCIISLNTNYKKVIVKVKDGTLEANDITDLQKELRENTQSWKKQIEKDFNNLECNNNKIKDMAALIAFKKCPTKGIPKLNEMCIPKLNDPDTPTEFVNQIRKVQMLKEHLQRKAKQFLREKLKEAVLQRNDYADLAVKPKAVSECDIHWLITCWTEMDEKQKVYTAESVKEFYSAMSPKHRRKFLWLKCVINASADAKAYYEQDEAAMVTKLKRTFPFVVSVMQKGTVKYMEALEKLVDLDVAARDMEDFADTYGTDSLRGNMTEAKFKAMAASVEKFRHLMRVNKEPNHKKQGGGANYSMDAVVIFAALIFFSGISVFLIWCGKKILKID